MDLSQVIETNIHAALAEDLGGSDFSNIRGDLTAQLIPADTQARARIICRDAAILAGQAWAAACFHALDPLIGIHWHAHDGETITSGQLLCELEGNARALLTAERSALNFLQTLSGVATATRHYVEAIAGTKARIYDTRKTLPGLRLAMKYAVRCGGGQNHRAGLYDGILIKENHIAAAGGIRPALEQAAKLAPPGVFVQIEVESLVQLQEALSCGANLILLDNFDLAMMREAVYLTGGRAQLEASGGVDIKTVRDIAETGVDRISVGSLTKHVHAVDLSMRIIE